jgi:hypothetical protein
LLIDNDGHLARAVTTLPESITARVSVAASESDAQRVLDMHPDIQFVIVNGTRNAADARNTARNLKGFHPRIQVRMLAAVGTESSAETASDDIVDQIVGRSVFTATQLINLLTPRQENVVAPTAPATSPVRAILPTGLRVLVAEDNPVNQLVTRGCCAGSALRRRSPTTAARLSSATSMNRANSI